MIWCGTGNNVAVHADTTRRICHVRLESQHERPELRRDFKYPDLLCHVGQHRHELLAAALTILRAYFVAGMPSQNLSAWGSFQGWSQVVRSAVVWCGLADPAETRMQLQERSDVTAEYMGVLIASLEQLDPDRSGLTASEIIDTIKKYMDRRVTEATPAYISELKDAIEAMVGRLDAKALGYKLRSHRRRNFQGKYLDVPSTAKRAARWAVFRMQEFSVGPNHPHHAHHPHLKTSEDGEHGEDSSARTKSSEGTAENRLPPASLSPEFEDIGNGNSHAEPEEGEDEWAG
jgi:hypothetical protein